MDVKKALDNLLAKENIDGISKKAGVSEKEAKSVLSSALPLLINGLGKKDDKKPAQVSGLTALLTNFLKDDDATEQVSEESGVSSGKTGSILNAALPVVLSLLSSGDGNSSSNHSDGTGSLVSGILGGLLNSKDDDSSSSGKEDNSVAGGLLNGLMNLISTDTSNEAKGSGKKPSSAKKPSSTMKPAAAKKPSTEKKPATAKKTASAKKTESAKK